MQGARVENVFLNGELGALEGATCEFMSKEPEKEEDLEGKVEELEDGVKAKHEIIRRKSGRQIRHRYNFK